MLDAIFGRKHTIPSADDALPGRAIPVDPGATHHVSGRSMLPPFPEGSETVVFGMGCFWGAERIFWQVPGVFVTAVGYAGGPTENPSYREVCSGRTGHTEVVLVVFDPQQTSFDALLRLFWEGHDPSQGMRQGNDVGTQYRSAIFTSTPEQDAAAMVSRAAYQSELEQAGYGEITTEIATDVPFFYAEEAHQQYLSKNPSGYCGIGGTGVACPGSPSAGAGANANAAGSW
jgi:peptide-methionine (S)-S-oxide reductase